MSVAAQTRSFPSLVVLLVLAGVVLTFFRNREAGPPPLIEGLPEYCRGLSEEECRELGFQSAGEGQASVQGSGRVLRAEEVCVGVGYLCADVTRTGEMTVRRWPETTPGLRIWVPEPESLPPSMAREFQRAVTRGLQVWHNHPFPLTISTRSVRENPDITVEWVRSLGENRLGEARTEWREANGTFQMSVPGFVLVTHHPARPGEPLTPDEVRLVAAHEMGHALGLRHSDDQRDLMYPQNTAWRPTARDYRTMEAVYRMPNGALIRR